MPSFLCLQMAGLQREVGGHEPASALDGGEGEGLDSLRAVCEGAARTLMPGGFLALEVRYSTTGGTDSAGLPEQYWARVRAERLDFP